MNFSELGTVSDIVSTVAVVCTLAYIAVQMRHARIAADAQGTVASVEIYSRWRAMFLQNSDLAVVLAKANAGEQFSDAERIQLSSLCDQLYYGSSGSFAASLGSGSIHDHQAEVAYVTDLMDANPGIIADWRRGRHIVEGISPLFGSLIDEHLARKLADNRTQ